MKYVILLERYLSAALETEYTRVHPLIFPEYMTHRTVALGYIAAFKQEEGRLLEIAGAGFCYHNDEDVTRPWSCKSGSESLSMENTDSGSALGEIVLNMYEAQQGLLV